MTNRDILIQLLAAIALMDDKITKLEELGVTLTTFNPQVLTMERTAMYLATGNANMSIPDDICARLLLGRDPVQVADELMALK